LYRNVSTTGKVQSGRFRGVVSGISADASELVPIKRRQLGSCWFFHMIDLSRANKTGIIFIRLKTITRRQGDRN
jgi:hypothetical protein